MVAVAPFSPEMINVMLRDCNIYSKVNTGKDEALFITDR